MFDRLLQLSHRDGSNKWPNIIISEEITQVESIEVNFTHGPDVRWENTAFKVTKKNRHRSDAAWTFIKYTNLQEIRFSLSV